LGLNLLLFLVKSADDDITHIYDPVINFYNKYIKGINPNGPIKAAVSKKNNKAAITKLEKVLDSDTAKHSAEAKQSETAKQGETATAKQGGTTKENNPIKKYKKLPVIPQADDSTSSVQMKPTSKSGFCYIGEDRGFRSCITVGAGDVCMSGDIFPTEAICINPKLRQ
jgi:hypothetical protein